MRQKILCVDPPMLQNTIEAYNPAKFTDITDRYYSNVFFKEIQMAVQIAKICPILVLYFDSREQNLA